MRNSSAYIEFSRSTVQMIGAKDQLQYIVCLVLNLANPENDPFENVLKYQLKTTATIRNAASFSLFAWKVPSS
jgi:hypothetical protein